MEKAKDRCSNSVCNRKYGDIDDRKPEKTVKKSHPNSRLCSVCYYERYEKNSERKKEYMKNYRKKYRPLKKKKKEKDLLKIFLEDYG